MSPTSPPPPQPAAGHPSLWSRPERGARGPQPEHSRDAIAAAAVGLADADGLTAVTMRAVAGALGTAAASLYRYLSSRDDLLDLMADAVLSELRLDRGGAADWLDDLVGLAQDQLALHRRHPWLLEAGLRGRPLAPNATAYFEYCLRALEPVTAGTATKMEAVAMINGVVSLFARSAATPSRPLAPSELFATADPSMHPHLVAALTRPTPSRPRSDLFERTLRSVLLGVLADD